MISVAILDTQNRLLLESLSVLLSGKDEINITGRFFSISDFLKDIRTLSVNVLVINLYQIHLEEIELIKMISKEIMRIKVLVISMDNSNETVFESIRAGAKGCLTKNDQGNDVLMAIYSIRNGYDYYNKSISNILMNYYISSIEKKPQNKQKPPDNLSKREIEIIKLWGAGLSNKDMADKLFISVRTVESHKNHIMQKLNLKTNVELMKFAIRNNLLKI